MRHGTRLSAGDLKAGLHDLIRQQAVFLATIDWDDPEQVSLAEKRGRIIQVHRGNVEKTLGMDDRRHTPNPDDPFDGNTAALREELERRLLRHADALGQAELLRRVRARGVDPSSLGLVLPGEDGSEGTRG